MKTQCRHADKGRRDQLFRGMKKVGLADESITYECPDCGQSSEVPRCIGLTDRAIRCQLPARWMRTTCGLHLTQEAS